MARTAKAPADSALRGNPKKASAGDAALGMRLREARLEAGMSQEKLGELLGVTFQQIQKYEKGVNRISAERLKLISTVLDRPPSFFYGDGEDVEVTTARAGLVNRNAVSMLRYFNKLPEVHQRALVAAARAMAGTEDGAEGERPD